MQLELFSVEEMKECYAKTYSAILRHSLLLFKSFRTVEYEYYFDLAGRFCTSLCDFFSSTWR